MMPRNAPRDTPSMLARRNPILLPLRAIAALVALGALFALCPLSVGAQAENLLNRISNERLHDFEAGLTKEMNAALSRYISKGQYVLAVKVIWNPDVIPLVDTPGLAQEQQKLPGFPIFVRSPDSPAADQGTPPFVRMEVKVLIDETLPEYYERFVRKIIPIVGRLDFNRGDQVTVLKETFPVLPEEERVPPTLPEKELMEQLGETPFPGRQPPMQQVPQAGFGAMLSPQLSVAPSPSFSPQGATSLSEAAQVAYDERRFQDALRVVQLGFQRSTTNAERSFYLGMEGSIFYTMNNTEGAKASWRRAVTFDPSNMEVHRALNYLESAPGKEAK